MDLIRIFPGAQIGGNVFRDPDEKRDKQKAENQVDLARLFNNGEVDIGAPEHEKNGGDQEVANIVQETIGKKIYVDGDDKRQGIHIKRIVFQAELKQLPGAHGVTGYCRVHESAEKRDRRDFEITELRVTPGAD